MAEPALLDLVTVQTRPTAKIDGREYEIRTSNDFSLAAHRKIGRLSPRLGQLMLKEESSEAEEKELSAGLDEVARMVLIDVPDDVHQRLGDVNRMYIFGLFTDLLTPSLLRARAGRKATTEAGTISSHDSPATTAAAPSNGSRTSRSGRSRRASR